MIVDEEVRPDGRRPDEIRPVSCEVSIIPRVHGSGLFTRGQTQVLSVATLGATSDIQELDTTGLEEFKRYIHHYNFPPFAVGETRPCAVREGEKLGMELWLRGSIASFTRGGRFPIHDTSSI